VLRQGFLLPPLMFSKDEIEALVLGSHWVAARADDALARAARNAVAKIASVLPGDLRDELDVSALQVKEAPIRSLLEHLDLTAGEPNRGYQFRFGLVSATERDIRRIATAMNAKVPLVPDGTVRIGLTSHE
jgi:hypothetical protein